MNTPTDPFYVPDNRVMKSYVWHHPTNQCFFVSTIERDSSAMYNPGRYNETMAWVYDWVTSERGAQVAMDEACTGSIRGHIRVCEKLHEKGAAGFEEPEE